MIIANIINGWWFARTGINLASSTELDRPGFRKLGLGYAVIMSLPWMSMGIGILYGNISSPFRYFQRPNGDFYILMFYFTVFGLLMIGFLWIFFAGGDLFLNRYFKPIQQASRKSYLWARLDIRTQYVLLLVMFGLSTYLAWRMDLPDFAAF